MLCATQGDGKTMTTTYETERAVLCCAFMRPDDAAWHGELTVWAFKDVRHRVLWDAVRKWGGDAQTVIGRLEGAGRLEAAGGVRYIAGITDSLATTAFRDAYVAMLRERREEG